MTMIRRGVVGCWLDNQERAQVGGENKEESVAVVELIMDVWRGS